ncbi:unnamed protein product, partial [Scytosiphon promiscuus]
ARFWRNVLCCFSELSLSLSFSLCLSLWGCIYTYTCPRPCSLQRAAKTVDAGECTVVVTEEGPYPQVAFVWWCIFCGSTRCAQSCVLLFSSFFFAESRRRDSICQRTNPVPFAYSSASRAVSVHPAVPQTVFRTVPRK